VAWLIIVTLSPVDVPDEIVTFIPSARALQSAEDL